jgi:uncharacterized membrane protein YphA (DoxX/SURF4 family)
VTAPPPRRVGRLPFLLLGGALALVLGGPGAFALDRLVTRPAERAALAR